MRMFSSNNLTGSDADRKATEGERATHPAEEATATKQAPIPPGRRTPPIKLPRPAQLGSPIKLRQPAERFRTFQTGPPFPPDLSAQTRPYFSPPGFPEMQPQCFNSKSKNPEPEPVPERQQPPPALSGGRTGFQGMGKESSHEEDPKLERDMNELLYSITPESREIIEKIIREKTEKITAETIRLHSLRRDELPETWIGLETDIKIEQCKVNAMKERLGRLPGKEPK